MSTKYIPALDGLRALAVMLVVLFHADVNFFQGGYIGVDVFFVISGYIITKGITSDLDRGTFSLRSFYVKRVARLIPAMLATVVLTLLAAWWILSPAQLQALGQQAMYATLAISNILFWMESGYFDAASETKAFLHTWSLGVEEQFYLFWPAFLLALSVMKSRFVIILGVALISFLSLTAALFYYKTDPSAVFFLMPFRVFELGFGALIALSQFKLAGLKGALAALIGVFVIVCLSWAVEEGASVIEYALLPTLASMLVLLGVTSSIVSATLGVSPLAWLGRISYSVYLVHWPVVVLWKAHYGSELSTSAQIFMVVSAIAGGWLLSILVENRFRFRSTTTEVRKGTVLGCTAIFACLSLFASGHYWGLTPQSVTVSGAVTASYDTRTLKAQRVDLVRRGTCDIHSNNKFEDFDQELCSAIDPAKRNVLIIGDSFAADVWLAMTSAYPEVNFAQATAGSCSLYDDAAAEETIKRTYEACTKLNEFRLGNMLNKDWDSVIVAANWTEWRVADFEQVFPVLSASGKKIVVFGQRAIFNRDAERIIFDMSRQEVPGKASDFLRPESWDSRLRKRVGDQAVFVDVLALQCLPDCYLQDNQLRPLYTDHAHLSVYGAQFFGSKIRDEYRNSLIQ